MKDLIQITYDQNLRFASFDISNTYTNIPTDQIPKIVASLCNQNHLHKKLTREFVKITRTLLKQNYSQFYDTIHAQTEGLAMGSPTRSIFSEVYIQYLEHTVFSEILIPH
jgi:hypothetical protein